MITRATKEMLPDLIEIWSECFGDAEEYSGFFFQHQKATNDMFEHVYVWVEEERPVSMLTILPARLVLDKEEKVFWYVYAVATKIEFRKHGFVRKMLDYIYEKSIEQNAVIGLTPATKELVRFYEKLGFHSVFYERTMVFPLQEKKTLYSFEECNAEEYLKIRNQMFMQRGFVKWDDNAVSYALAENTLVGGKHFILRNGEQSHLILCCVTNQELHVKETTLPQESLVDVISYIGRKLNCKTAIVRLHPTMYKEGTPQAFAMIRGYQDAFTGCQGYLGLALD